MDFDEIVIYLFSKWYLNLKYKFYISILLECLKIPLKNVFEHSVMRHDENDSNHNLVVFFSFNYV